MKKIKSIIIIALLLFFIPGCNDYLDVNHNPDALESIPDVKVLLPTTEIGIGVNLMGWDFGLTGGLWVEYWTQSYTASQFKSICEYQPQEFGTAFTSLLAQSLTDLKRIKEISAETGSNGYYFVAEALSIFAWQIMADVWGGLPYFEALQGEDGVTHPKFDKGEDIHADLLQRINALLATDLSASSIDGTYDYIYKGDLDKWKQFAYSLKLKLLLRVSEAGSYNNAAVLSFIEDGATSFITESAKIPGNVWDDAVEGKRHPIREFEAGGAGYLSTNVIACKSFLDYLQVNNDPRLPKLFTAVSSNYRGAFFGDFDSKFASDGSTADDRVTYSKVVFAGNMDLPIMSLWEVNFYIAEVYARAGNYAKAKEHYDAAVAASFAQHGLSNPASITGAGEYAEWTSTSSEAGIKQIAMQKWVANANYQHIESFLERNRTKYPPVNDINIKSDRRAAFSTFPVGSLTISVNGRERLNGNLPASPIYPSAYLNRNNNAPSQKRDLSEKVWWDKKSGK
jgi:tetratricopeptide (TPR) repeat protein